MSFSLFIYQCFCLLEWGMRSAAHGLLFFPREGGSCWTRLSCVCLSVTLADRKNQHFREIRQLVLAGQTPRHAQNAQFLRCAKIHHRCSQRCFHCVESAILRAQGAETRVSELVCNLTQKPVVPPLEGLLGPSRRAQEPQDARSKMRSWHIPGKCGG